MPLILKYHGSFKRDYKRVLKRGKDKSRLEEVILLLVKEKPLPARCKDHKLTGNYVERRDCHIESDWLLIYRVEGDFLYLERTGSHADLFK